MKKLIAIMAGALLCGCTSTAQKNDTIDAQAEDTKSAVLVAYFSATGNTEKVAKEIAAATDGTLYVITPETKYTDEDLDWHNNESRSSVEMADSTSRPALAGDKINAGDFEVIFIGYPIWWDLCPRVVNTWIDSQDLAGKKVVPFATSGSSTIDNSVNNLRKLYPNVDWQTGKLLNQTDGLTDWAKSYLK